MKIVFLTLALLLSSCSRPPEQIGQYVTYVETECILDDTYWMPVYSSGTMTLIPMSNCLKHECVKVTIKRGKYFWNDVVVDKVKMDPIICL